MHNLAVAPVSCAISHNVGREICIIRLFNTTLWLNCSVPLLMWYFALAALFATMPCPSNVFRILDTVPLSSEKAAAISVTPALLRFDKYSKIDSARSSDFINFPAPPFEAADSLYRIFVQTTSKKHVSPKHTHDAQSCIRREYVRTTSAAMETVKETPFALFPKLHKTLPRELSLDIWPA